MRDMLGLVGDMDGLCMGVVGRNMRGGFVMMAGFGVSERAMPAEP